MCLLGLLMTLLEQRNSPFVWNLLENDFWDFTINRISFRMLVTLTNVTAHILYTLFYAIKIS